MAILPTFPEAVQEACRELMGARFGAEARSARLELPFIEHLPEDLQAQVLDHPEVRGELSALVQVELHVGLGQAGVPADIGALSAACAHRRLLNGHAADHEDSPMTHWARTAYLSLDERWDPSQADAPRISSAMQELDSAFGVGPESMQHRKHQY